MLYWRRGVLAIVATLVACGDNGLGSDDAGGVDDADVIDDAMLDAGIDGPSDAPVDASIDAPPGCGDGLLQTGEECDTGVWGLSGDGCSSSCTLETMTWTNLTPNPAPRRSGLAMAYDAVRDRLVMFGGSTGYLSSPTNETWEWDGTTWTKILTLVAPPAREDHALVYDSERERIVLFGGAGTTGYLADTWEWDGMMWTQRFPAASPPAQASHYMAYDPMRQVSVLWSPFSGAVWEWDGTNWADKTPAQPPTFGGYGLTYAGGLGVMLVGGASNWLWNGTTWSEVSFAAQVPWTAGSAVTTYDSAQDRVIVLAYPGTDRDGLGVWAWINNNWIEQLPTQPGGPKANYPGVAYDSKRELVMVFGGDAPGPDSDATWEWNGTRWRMWRTSLPPPRWEQSTTYDARRARVVMFGGTGTGPANDDTWEWDGTTWSQRISAVAPPPRYAGAMAYDERRGVTVLFGGLTPIFDASRTMSLTAYYDTWEWNGSTWQQRFPTTSPGPHACCTLPEMTYDRKRGYVILTDDVGTWTWDGTNWTKQPVSATPGAGRLAYDARRGVTVLVTWGWDATSQVSTYMVYEWNGASWTSKGSAPGFGYLLYDPLRARVVMNTWNFNVDHEVWSWDGVSWSKIGVLPFGALEFVFDRASRSWFNFAGETAWDTWLVRLGATDPREQCDGSDADGDGLTRCNDPDCWPRCNPLCAPGEIACDPNRPRCGDGTCSSIEDAALCPADCP